MSKQQRPRRNAEQWEKIIKEQEASGESVSVYCHKRDVCEKSFYAWRRRLSGEVAPEGNGFIEVPVFSKSHSALCIKTPQGYCLEVPEGMDSVFVGNIIAALVSK